MILQEHNKLPFEMLKNELNGVKKVIEQTILL